MITIRHKNLNGLYQEKQLIDNILDLKTVQVSILSQGNKKLQSSKDSNSKLLIGTFSRLGEGNKTLLAADGYPVDKVFGKEPLCHHCDDCKGYCYNKNLNWRANVINSRISNTLITMDDELFEKSLFVALSNFQKLAKKQGKQPVVRVHVEGDFATEGYLQNWLKAMLHFSDIQFYGYTKCFELIHDYKYHIQSLGNYNLMLSDNDSLSSKTKAIIHDLRRSGFKSYYATNDVEGMLEENPNAIECYGDCHTCQNCILGVDDVAVKIR